ncbi:hypothetical protein SAMN04487983_105615 [Streptomyces sp. yr375]|uniref:hypothetical protein n=1 Tax=Streptomyces sp. yr375 TaxID=1761906 RepID=UPI0008CB48B1|nr:hypothetical protein [Streptomyces sp. yr375]SES44734.1 hypothetical protein SAMN04487983_105615 [Streptomyces sp. yr375]
MESVSAVMVAAEVGLTEFQQNLVVAVVGAVVGALGTAAIERVKLRREPTKQLSWDAEVHNAMVSTDETIGRLLRLSYNGHPIEGLSSVEFRVENTGNRVVKDEHLRFSFPPGAQIIEAVPTSDPEREMGVTRRPKREQAPGEAVFTIGQLERGQAVALRLSVSAGDIEGWKVVSHNEEGDVDFHERSAARRREDREHVPAFFTLAFLLLTVPPVFSLLGYAGQLAAVVLSTAFLISIVPHIAPTGRTLRDFLTRPEPLAPGIHIGSVDSSTFAIGTSSSASTRTDGNGPHRPS